MNHVELAATETWNPDTTTCCFCGREGSGLIHDGWDSVTSDDGTEGAICPGCANPYEEYGFDYPHER